MAEARMRALVVGSESQEGSLSLDEVSRPSPRDRQVRVRVSAAGVNRADVLQRRGLYPSPPGVDPRIPGLEYSGVVEELGPQARRRRLGDRVMGLVAGAAYAEHVIVHEDETIPVPQTLDLLEAAAVPEAFLTAYDAIYLQGRLGQGEWCLIRAATSGVGIAACQLLRALGERSLGTSRHRPRVEALGPWGLDEGLVEGEDDIVAAVQAATGGRGVSVVLDLVGGGRLDENLRCLQRRGRLVLVGLLAGSRDQLDLARMLTRRLQIIGTVMRSRRLDEKIELARVFEDQITPRVARGELRPVVDSVWPWEEAMTAHRRMESNEHLGKIVLAVSPLARNGAPGATDQPRPA